MSSCIYQYNGVDYTRFEIIKMIRDGVIAAPLNESEARAWLRDKLGLQEEQVEVVKGLIDNNTFGRFLEDGTLLLSDELQGVEYHEAFHRVWRTLLTEKERASVHKEFMSRKSSLAVLAKKKLLYPEVSEDVLVEEVLAEEFMFYQLQNNSKTNTWFDRIINFFKQIFGLSIEQLYQNIEAGKYAKRTPTVYAGEQRADMRLWNMDVDTVTKQELVSAIAYDMLGTLVEQQYLEELVRGQIDVTEVFKVAIQNVLLNTDNGGLYGLQDTNYDLAEAVYEDTFDDNLNVKPSSVLLQELVNYLAQINIDVKLDEETPDVDESDVDSTANEENAVGDNAFMKISFEFNPLQGVTTKAKLIVASLGQTNSDGTLKLSRKLGLPQTMVYGKAANIIFDTLAGVPKDYSVVYEKLEEAGVKYPFLFKLTQYLGEPGGIPTDYLQVIRSEFLSSFVQNKYTFVKALFTPTDMKVINLGNESQSERYNQLWKNRLEVSWNSDEELLSTLKGLRTAADVATALGMQELVEQDLLLEPLENGTVASKILDLRSIVIEALNKGTLRYNLFSKQTDKTIEIEGSVRKLSEVAASKGVPFDAMLLNGERKRIFSISKHSYQTLIVGTLNWIANQELSYEERLELLKKHAPHLLHVGVYSEGKIHSMWLNKILSGIPMKIEVFDAVGARRKNLSTHKTGVTDQLALMVNNVYYGRMFSFKHGDRSVMFTYRFQDREMFVDTLSLNKDRIIEEAVAKAAPLLLNDLRMARMTKDTTNPHLGYGTVNVHKNRGKLTVFDFVTPEEADNIYTEDDVITVVGPKLIQFFENSSANTLRAMNDERLFASGSGATSPIGITEDLWKQAFADNNNSVEKTREAIAAFVEVNYFLSYVEEMFVLTGTPIHYKNAVDFFKRIQMQSSTGTAMQTDESVELYIQQLNAQDEFELVDPQTKKKTKVHYGIQGVAVPGKISEVVLESQDYRSAYLDIKMTSKLDGTQVSLPFYITEQGVLEELKATRPELSEAEMVAIAKAKAKENEQSLENYDENDGSSWINMFYYRRYMITTKAWNPRLENTFQIELAVLQNTGNLADTTVYVDAAKENIRAKAPDESWTAVRIFDVKDIADQLELSKGGLRWLNKFTQPFGMLKPQYTGPYYPDANVTEERLNLIAGRKESHAVLTPSAIRGTKLEQMHAMMLRNGLDIIHMDSAAKYGRKMYGIFAPVEATKLYGEDGNFNSQIETYIDKTVSYLDPAYMKDQLEVSPYPKSKIRNASQSTKLLVSDMFANGVPVDVSETRLKELFPAMSEAEKKSVSPMYTLYANYKDALHGLLNKTIAELDKEMGTDSMVDALRRAAENRSEPQYILDSIEQLTSGLELLPNWNRVENILYSLVSNAAISFKRPGDGKPQWSLTMWEKPGSNEKAVSNYKFEFNKAGDLVKINPAEAILPLSPDMINWLLQAARTTNIVAALDWYERLPDSKKILVKGLRIPNQQFSFNDVYTVKRFTVPTLQAFAVLPSEVVVKMGTDFDIDKTQLYFPVLDRKGRVIRKAGTVLERMMQYQKFDRIEYEDDTQVEVDGELLSVTAAKKRVDARIRKLEKEKEQIIQEFTADHPIHEEEDLLQIKELYGLDVATIPEMITVLNNRMVAAALSGESVESYEQALDDLDDFINDYLFENLDEVSDALKEHIEGKMLEAFEQAYPTEDLQVHPAVWHNELLMAEIDLLLSSKNAHRIFSSVDDSWFSKDLFAEIMALKYGVTRSQVLANYDEYVLGKLTMQNFLSVAENVKRSIIMLESKANVGLVATAITGHSVWQVDGVQIAEGFEFPITGVDVQPAPVFSADNRYISEVLSTLLTSQVDGVKNPYAPALGLTSKTLPVVTMLMRHNVPLRVALLITANPLVQEYLDAVSTNNSFTLSSASGKLSVRYKEAQIFQRIAGRKHIASTTMSVEDLERAMTTKDSRVLDVFKRLSDLSDQYFTVQMDMTADTKPMKSLAQLQLVQENESEVYSVIQDRTYTKGLLTPFFVARSKYSSYFNPLYVLDHNKLNEIHKAFSSGREGQEESIRRYTKLTNDFILFVIQNFAIPNTSFEELLSGPNSVAKEVQAILDEQGQSANYALSQLLPMLNIGKVNDANIDNVRIQERGMTNVQMNDMYAAFSDLPMDLQKKLVYVSLYQAGVNNSRFTLREMLQSRMVQQVLGDLKPSINKVFNTPELLNSFKTLYLFNNVDVLPDNIYAARYRKMQYIRVEENNTVMVQSTATGIKYNPRGSVYPAVLNYKLSDEKLNDAQGPTEGEPGNAKDIPNNIRTQAEFIASEFKKRFNIQVNITDAKTAKEMINKSFKDLFFKILDEVDVFNSKNVEEAKSFIFKVFKTVETPEEANKAFKKLAVKYHPDKGGSEEIMKYINDTYDRYKDGTLDPPKARTQQSTEQRYRANPSYGAPKAEETFEQDPDAAAFEEFRKQAEQMFRDGGSIKFDFGFSFDTEQEAKQTPKAETKIASKPSIAQQLRKLFKRNPSAVREEYISFEKLTTYTDFYNKYWQTEDNKLKEQEDAARSKIFSQSVLSPRWYYRKKVAKIEQQRRDLRKRIDTILADLSKAWQNGTKYRFQYSNDNVAGFYNVATKQAYVVLDNIDDTTFIHEAFSHPLIEAIKVRNRALYDNLLKEAKLDKNVVDKVNNTYVDQEIQDVEYIAAAIDLDAKGKLKNKTLAQYIKEFWNAVSAIIKDIFSGKANLVENINPDTTISELVDFVLMSGQSLDLDVSVTKNWQDMDNNCPALK